MTFNNYVAPLPKNIIYIFSTLGDSNGALVVNNAPLVANGIAANAATSTLSIGQQISIWPGGKGWFQMDANSVFTANGFVQVGCLPQFMIPPALGLINANVTYSGLVANNPTSIIPELIKVTSAVSNTVTGGISCQAYVFHAPLGFIYMNAVAPNANSSVYIPTAWAIPLEDNK